MTYKDKPCASCKKIFTPMGTTNTCSEECKHLYRLTYKKKWYKKHATRIYKKYFDYRMKHYKGRQIALRLVKKLGIKRICALCNSDYVVDIHHKDGNTSNNTLENLQILCRYCHAKIHKTQSKPAQ